MHDAPTSIKVKKAESVLEITWGDDPSARISVRDLRCSCPCAACIDERTGRKTLDDATVPADVGVTDMQLVGSYAVHFVFTDGHETGIYSWDHLYHLTSTR